MDLGRATSLSSIFTSNNTSNSINISCSIGREREAARFGSSAVLVLMVGAFCFLDLVRRDTGSVCDRVRLAIASGSGRLTFLIFRTGGLGVNCFCRSFDRFFFLPFEVYECEGPGGLNVIVRGGMGRSWQQVMSIAAALVEQFVRSHVARVAQEHLLLALRFLRGGCFVGFRDVDLERG